jgi:hypothetical protein
MLSGLDQTNVDFFSNDMHTALCFIVLNVFCFVVFIINCLLALYFASEFFPLFCDLHTYVCEINDSNNNNI